jgi:hypothetical protein
LSGIERRDAAREAGENPAIYEGLSRGGSDEWDEIYIQCTTPDFTVGRR